MASIAGGAINNRLNSHSLLPLAAGKYKAILHVKEAVIFTTILSVCAR
jgi:hypothetical protein